jgi:hypothetical protein
MVVTLERQILNTEPARQQISITLFDKLSSQHLSVTASQRHKGLQSMISFLILNCTLFAYTTKRYE